MGELSFRTTLNRELAQIGTDLGVADACAQDADEAIAIAGLAPLMTPEGVARIDADDVARLRKALSHIFETEVPLRRVVDALARTTRHWAHDGGAAH